MQRVVSGRASRRLTEISSPHSSQTPNVPSSIFRRAFSILSRKLFSRPRSRKVKDWRYSLDARSISSGRSSVSSAMSCSSVCLAFLRISSRLSVRRVLNFLRVALFTVDLESRRPPHCKVRCGPLPLLAVPCEGGSTLSTAAPAVNRTRKHADPPETPHPHL